MSLGIGLIAFGFTKSIFSLLAVLVLFPLACLYLYGAVDLRINKEASLINQELVYATRYLIIQVESGIPLSLTFENIGKNYEHAGRYFREINEKITLGTPLPDALNQAVELCPSNELRKILWQILNSLRIGSEITESLQTVLDQVVREQKIAVVEYGRKLNPIAMMYMMMAVIVPSLGTVMLIVMATFIGFKLTLTVLLILSGLLLFLQFMFLAMIKSQRPAVEL